MKKLIYAVMVIFISRAVLGIPGTKREVNFEEGRITGGSDAPQTIPFLVHIQTYNKSDPNTILSTCSGAIIKENMVVTTATCMLGDNANWVSETASVLAGSRDRAVLEVQNTVQFALVRSYVVHPKFWFNSLENNIALLNLDKPLKVDGTSVALIPVARSAAVTNIAGKTVTIYGWGTNTSDINQTPEQYNFTQVLVNVPVSKADDCEKQVAQKPFYFKLPATTFCFIVSVGTGMCNMDNGAVAVASLKMGTLKDPVPQLVGIGSWWLGSVCPGTLQAPNIFTRVPDYAKWIQENGGPDPQKFQV